MISICAGTDSDILDEALLRSYLRNNGPVAAQVDAYEKAFDPEQLYKQFTQGAASLDLRQLDYISKIIMNRGSGKLKQAFLQQLYKCQRRSFFCKFELGKILYYGKGSGNRQEKQGLKIIGELAEAGMFDAIYFLIDHYEKRKDKDKVYYYLEKLAQKGDVTEKLVYASIERKDYTKARKYFSLYIKKYQDDLNKLETYDKSVSIDNPANRPIFIQTYKERMKREKEKFSKAINNAKTN